MRSINRASVAKYCKHYNYLNQIPQAKLISNTTLNHSRESVAMRVRIVPFASTYSRDCSAYFAQILCAACLHLPSIKIKVFLSLYHKLSKMMISCHQALNAISMRNDLAKPHALPKFSLRTYLCLHNTAIAVAGAEAMAGKYLGSTAR